MVMCTFMGKINLINPPLFNVYFFVQLHPLAGAGRPPGDHHERPLHVGHLHPGLVAVGRARVQAVGNCEGHLDRGFRVHPHRPVRGPLLRHRRPSKEVSYHG